MMRKLFMFVLAGCLALFAVGVSAQTLTTGSLEGSVTDANGAAVPGVTIVATRQGGSPRTATSNNEGRYTFPQLEPGKYKVTVEATKGFGKFEDSIDVSLGKTSDFTVQLSPAGASATVNVTAAAGAALDVTANTTGTNVSTEQFSNFPTQRTVQSLYTIAPTVARSGLRDSSGRDRDPSVGGSSGPENNYILDGVGVADPTFGADATRLFVLFAAPVQNELRWSESGIEGAVRFLRRVWTIVYRWRPGYAGLRPAANEGHAGGVRTQEFSDAARALRRKTHQTIARVTSDFEKLDLNTNVAALMELLNAIGDFNVESSAAFSPSSQADRGAGGKGAERVNPTPERSPQAGMGSTSQSASSSELFAVNEAIEALVIMR